MNKRTNISEKFMYENVKTLKRQKGITLIALVITIVILLILAGITIKALSGENGLIAKVNQAKKAQIKAEMKETLILAINELQLEKEGNATLDDITQEWANETLDGYNPQITTDASIDGKKVTMKKSSVRGKYIIDDKLNVIEVVNDSSIEFSYEVKSRNVDKIQILINVQDEENGLSKIEFPDRNPLTVEENKKEEKRVEYEVEIGKEYKIKITSENGQTKEETILITDYWYSITKNLEEGVVIDNKAIKAAYNKPYQATITTQENYVITELTVKMSGQAVTTSGNNVIDKTTGIINIEKVTGDIEITATAKKLQIQYTAIAIGKSNSASNTSSVADNSLTRGTTLYINIIAKLEGTTCTVTLKDDNTKIVPYAITRNGKYTFVVSGTYNGKTISEEKEVTANKYETATGLVQYDAGDWTKSEIQSLKTAGLYNLNASKKGSSSSPELNLTFGGFTYKGDTENSSYINDGTIITSRNQSVAPQSGTGTPKYDGWQILEIKDSSGNIISRETEISNKLDNLSNGERIYVTKLVHAGSPENFTLIYMGVLNDDKRAEYILSSGLRQTDYGTLSSGETINPRHWDIYKDKKQLDLIEEVHCMTYNEAYSITESVESSGKILTTGADYYLGTINDNRGKFLWKVLKSGWLTSGTNLCSGIRPVIALKTGVFIMSGTGTEGDPYILAME